MSRPGIILRLVSTSQGGDTEAHLMGVDLVIGRDQSSDLWLPGDGVSLSHVRLRWSNGAYVLTPHPAKGPNSAVIMVGGVPVTRSIMLQEGAQISTAGCVFEVVAMGVGITASTAAVSSGPAADSENMVSFGQGAGQYEGAGTEKTAKPDPGQWLKDHWPTVIAGVAVLVGGLVFMLIQPKPPPPKAAVAKIEFCDRPFSPATTDSCSTPDDCAKKAEAAQARALRKAETGAVGYEIMADALTAVELAKRGNRQVDVARAQAFVDAQRQQLTHLCRSVRLMVTQAARSGNDRRAFRACRSLLDAVPDPADPRYVWARKCVVDFAQDY